MTASANTVTSGLPQLWKPGQSGNPTGRPKSAGLASYLQKETRDGAELGDFMLSILRLSGPFEGARIPVPVRMEAATWIADRAFGKPVQSTEISAGSGAVMIAYMPSVSGEDVSNGTLEDSETGGEHGEAG